MIELCDFIKHDPSKDQDNKRWAELSKAKKILKEWVNKQGHERCWYYPDLFEKLCKTLDVQPSKKPNLPPLKEFKKGCCKYQKEQYSKNDHKLWKGLI